MNPIDRPKEKGGKHIPSPILSLYKLCPRKPSIVTERGEVKEGKQLTIKGVLRASKPQKPISPMIVLSLNVRKMSEG